MKKLTTFTALALSISAATALAQSSIDQITAQLQAEGFGNIEVEVKDGTIEIEGYRAGQEREMVFDAATWELLKDETHADLEGDDDDEAHEAEDGDSDDDQDDDLDDDHDSKDDDRDDD